MSMRQKVLLVEDDATTRFIIKSYLKARAFEFAEASDGEEGLRVATAAPPDLVIADLHMPGMDGLEFIANLRRSAKPELRDMPVILLTSDRTESFRARARAIGVSEFLLKPVKSAGIPEVVDRVLPAPQLASERSTLLSARID